MEDDVLLYEIEVLRKGGVGVFRWKYSNYVLTFCRLLERDGGT